MSSFNYGGQAVIEGVMMRGEHDVAIAVRTPSGDIAVRREPLSPLIYRSRILKLPFLRGLTMLWDSLGLGLRALTWSADMALEEEEDVSFSGPLAWGTIALSLVLGIGLFFLLPTFLVSLLDNYIHAPFWSNLAEGVVRLGIFLLYLWLIGFMPDIRRVFAYHGAEHKTINAYEKGARLVPEEVANYPRQHTRCGTGFLLIVLVIFVILSTIIGRPSLPMRLLSRLVLIPIVSGIAYEYLKFTARNYDKSAFIRALVAPNLALQNLTTREPDLKMLEVSIRSLQEVLDSEGLLNTEIASSSEDEAQVTEGDPQAHGI